MNDRSIYFCAFDFSVVCLFGGAIIYADDKYCATDICPPGAEHVACGRDIVCFFFTISRFNCVPFWILRNLCQYCNYSVGMEFTLLRRC